MEGNDITTQAVAQAHAATAWVCNACPQSVPLSLPGGTVDSCATICWRKHASASRRTRSASVSLTPLPLRPSANLTVTLHTFRPNTFPPGPESSPAPAWARHLRCDPVPLRAPRWRSCCGSACAPACGGRPCRPRLDLARPTGRPAARRACKYIMFKGDSRASQGRRWPSCIAPPPRNCCTHALGHVRGRALAAASTPLGGSTSTPAPVARRGRPPRRRPPPVTASQGRPAH